MNRTNLVLGLMIVALAIGVALDVTIGHEALFLYALPLPFGFTIFWLSRDVETFSDRVEATSAEKAKADALPSPRLVGAARHVG